MSKICKTMYLCRIFRWNYKLINFFCVHFFIKYAINLSYKTIANNLKILRKQNIYYFEPGLKLLKLCLHTIPLSASQFYILHVKNGNMVKAITLYADFCRSVLVCIVMQLTTNNDSIIV